MSAQPESLVQPGRLPSHAGVDAVVGATVLPLRQTDAQGRRLVQETSGYRLGPARGLLLGLGLGVMLWTGLAALAWEFFHR